VTSDPHRLYNLDVFEYELDTPMALYGSIPFMMGHAAGRTLGLLWLNTAETWIDTERMSTDGGVTPLVATHWFSETGTIDVWGFVGTTPAQVLFKYTTLTGASAEDALRESVCVRVCV
jgi:mannosyl-oligosaccharide alpha-1,3-glucosidase